MTQKEKETIIELQLQGKKYPTIAKLTGLDVDKVKYFCRRHPVETNTQPTTDAFCKGCGKPIVWLEKRKSRQFCSDACRMKWWNSHRNQVNHKNLKKKKCDYCGELFDAETSARKFCSRKCYDNFRREEMSK